MDGASKTRESSTSAQFEDILSLDKMLGVIFKIRSDYLSSIPEEMSLRRLAFR